MKKKIKAVITMTKRKTTILKMTEKDVEEVSMMEAANFSRPWRSQDFINMLNDRNVIGLVARQGEELVGCCILRNILGEGDVTNVQVKSTCRGQGICQKMLAELLDKGREMGIRVFILEVRAQNHAAVHAYEKLGFVMEGVRKGFYEEPKEDALIMWKR